MSEDRRGKGGEKLFYLAIYLAKRKFIWQKLPDKRQNSSKKGGLSGNLSGNSCQIKVMEQVVRLVSPRVKNIPRQGERTPWRGGAFSAEKQELKLGFCREFVVAVG